MERAGYLDLQISITQDKLEWLKLNTEKEISKDKALNFFKDHISNKVLIAFMDKLSNQPIVEVTSVKILHHILNPHIPVRFFIADSYFFKN